MIGRFSVYAALSKMAKPLSNEYCAEPPLSGDHLYAMRRWAQMIPLFSNVHIEGLG